MDRETGSEYACLFKLIRCSCSACQALRPASSQSEISKRQNHSSLKRTSKRQSPQNL